MVGRDSATAFEPLGPPTGATQPSADGSVAGVGRGVAAGTALDVEWAGLAAAERCHGKFDKTNTGFRLMKIGIILETNEPEKAWNGIGFGNAALEVEWVDIVVTF